MKFRSRRGTLLSEPSDLHPTVRGAPRGKAGGLLRFDRSDDSRRPAAQEISGAPAREISGAPATASKSGRARLPRLA